MWPLDRASTQECLRVGRHSVERWVGSSDALSLAGSCALVLAHELDAKNLTAALQNLYSIKPVREITVLLESAWVPVLLADVGRDIWTLDQVEALLRYRLGLLHGRDDALPQDWDLRIAYRVGERFALGYGMPVQLRRTVVDVGTALGLQWSALLPSFAWGLQRLRPAHQWTGRTGWWAWPEQDRLLLARIAANRIVVLNAGVASSEDPEQIAHLVEVERVRTGTTTVAEPITAATWAQSGHLATKRDRVSWVSISGQSNGPVPGSAWSPSKAYP